MTKKTALIVGASGLVGTYLARQLASEGGWEVYGVSRGKPKLEAGYRHAAFDLLDRDACRNALKEIPGVTHVFTAARVKNARYDEHESKNAQMFDNLLDGLDDYAPNLQHIHMVHGTKWYGSHLHPTYMPIREDDPREMPPNPYYVQQDIVSERQRGKRWTWSSTRPGVIMGYALGYPHNIVALVAAYVAISRELGVPLRFPGSYLCYGLVQSAIDVRILCKAASWVSQHPDGANQPFNVSNGDVFSWANLWPRIADFYGMKCGHVQPLEPFSEFMRDKDPIWDRVVRKHGLRPLSRRDVVAWEYGDYHFYKKRSDIVSTIKLLKTGFHDFIDTESLFIELLQRYRDEKIFP